MKRPLRLAATAACLALAVGCGINTDPTTTTASPEPSMSTDPATTTTPPEPSSSTGQTFIPPGYGMVLGHVTRDPGRDPRSGSSGTTGASVALGADPVQAKNQAGDEVARAVSGPDGSFQFTLPAGTYLITEEITGASQHITVTDQTTITPTLHVPAA